MLGQIRRERDSNIPVWRPEVVDQQANEGSLWPTPCERLESLHEELRASCRELQEVEQALEQQKGDAFLLKKYDRLCKREEMLLSERALWAGALRQNSNWEALQAAPGVKALLSRLVASPSIPLSSRTTAPGVWTPTPKLTAGKADQHIANKPQSLDTGKQRKPQKQLLMLAKAADITGSSGIRFVSPGGTSQNNHHDPTVKARQFRMAKRRIDRLTNKGCSSSMAPIKRHNSSKSASLQPRHSMGETTAATNGELVAPYMEPNALGSDTGLAAQQAAAEADTSAQADSGSGTNSRGQPLHEPAPATDRGNLAPGSSPQVVDATDASLTIDSGLITQDAVVEPPALQPATTERESSEPQDASGARSLPAVFVSGSAAPISHIGWNAAQPVVSKETEGDGLLGKEAAD